MPTRPTSRVSPNNANRVKLLPVSVIAPMAPTTASGSDISTARGRVTEPNSSIISMYISTREIASALKMSLNALRPVCA